MIEINQALEGKKVRVENKKGEIFEGVVGDYCYPEDDDNNLVMIILDISKGKYTGFPVGFYEKDIKSIEVIEEDY